MKNQIQAKYSLEEFSNILSVSKETLRRWDKSGKLTANRHPINKHRYYTDKHITQCTEIGLISQDNIQQTEYTKPAGNYTTIELFCGAGGLALGFEQAGLQHLLLNDIDKFACQTLRLNRPKWNIVENDISKIDFSSFFNSVDVISGGFPCQAFSYAGKKMGFNDARGTLFFEYARAIKEVQPKICIAENVKGLLNHENGKTLEGMLSIIESLGYTVKEPRVLNAVNYGVPQKRERLLIVAIRKDINIDFTYPIPCKKTYTLKDALKKGTLFQSDVPKSEGQKYPARKKEILDMVPPGGYWRDLPLQQQKEYMLKSYYLGGGKTGMARRISWDEPCLTLTCAPAQKQTERCHPEETRPFTIREYARIQTFPDEWIFSGTMTNQYKQIGNAVPVTLAKKIGLAVVDFLNQYYSENCCESTQSIK